MAPKRELSPDRPHQPHKEYPASLKYKVRGAIRYNQAHNPTATKQSVFDFFGVDRRVGYRMLKEDGPDRESYPRKENRGRKSKITKEDIQRMEAILIDGELLSWQDLAVKAGLVGERKVHFHTVREHVQDREYHKCTSCTRNWLAPRVRAERKSFALEHLNWQLQDWMFVRFSGEVHFGLSPQGRLRIIRKPGERLCVDCMDMQKIDEPVDKDEKKFHAWALVGWNYKSPLYWYETKDPYGRMVQQDYLDHILNPIIKPMLERGENFVLEEDQDRAHGPDNNNNRIQKWKDQHFMRYYINAPKSPDLNAIENAFFPLQQFLANTENWDEETFKTRAQEIWANRVSFEYINRQIETMEARIREVLDRDGRMIGH